ncbi:MAG: glycosyltransferase [bacterium]|nr:glycosyltransferase [bacterium]
MKVTFNPIRVNQVSHNTQVQTVSERSVANTNQPYALISFAGKIKNQISIIAAEAGPYFKEGGVSTVLADYHTGKVFPNGSVTFLHIPYYNGMRFRDTDGELLKNVEVVRDEKGGLFLTSDNLKKVSIDAADAKKKWELEELTRTTMDWGGKKESIGAYRIKGTNTILHFADETARMVKPYKDGSYSSKNQIRTMADGGEAYAKAMKAMSELFPHLEKHGINSEFIVLNDAQTATFPEYVSRQIQLGRNSFWDDAKIFYIQHNLGDGTYQGPTSFKTLFHNFATNDQIKAVWEDTEYLKAIRDGNEEKYFAQFFNPIPEKLVGSEPLKAVQKSTKAVTASMIPISYAAQNNLLGIATVSEGYADSVVNNPAVTNGLAEPLKKLQELNKFRGIVNGLSDPNIDPRKAPGLPFYAAEVTDNLGNIHRPFETYDPEWFSTMGDSAALEKIQQIKDKNKFNLFRRLQEGVDPKYAIGKAIDDTNIIGNIDRKWIEQLKRGEHVDLFVSWGRADDQKGLDIVMDAFKDFVKNHRDESKNSVLVLGGPLKDMPAEQVVRIKMAQFMADADLKGRVVFMDGFAPNTVLASAGDAAVLPSRFAPCELTDLEAMKFGTTPIVTGLQGMAQKNIDPSENAATATSFKTKAHSFMSEADVIAQDAQYAKFKTELSAKFKAEFELAKVKSGSSIVSFDEKTIEKLVEKALKESEELRLEYKKATDRLIARDVTEAMLKKVSLTPAEKATMMKNGMLAKVGWRDNNAFHPEKLSSAEIYENFFFKGKCERFRTTLFNYDFMPKITSNGRLGEALGRTNNLSASGFDSFGSSSKFLNKRVLGTIVGLVALGTWGYYLFKDNKKAESHPSRYIA